MSQDKARAGSLRGRDNWRAASLDSRDIENVPHRWPARSQLSSVNSARGRLVDRDQGPGRARFRRAPALATGGLRDLLKLPKVPQAGPYLVTRSARWGASR